MLLPNHQATAPVTTTVRGSGTAHGSAIITALEAAWAAIRQQHPEISAAVIITGSGTSQRGVREGYRLRGHYWPERWVTSGPGERLAPELFVAGELLDDGTQAVLEVMRYEAAHALAAVRGIKDCSAAGNRYHNRRFAALAAEVGLRPLERAHKILGMSSRRITDQTVTAYAGLIAAITAARLPYLTEPPATGGENAAEGPAAPGRRDGHRITVGRACVPPRRIQLTPRTLDDGPVICGLCGATFKPPHAQARLSPVPALPCGTAAGCGAGTTSGSAAEPGRIARSTSPDSRSLRPIALKPHLQRTTWRSCALPWPTALDRYMHQTSPRGQAT